MGKFQVGDTAIAVKPADEPYDELSLHGTEVTVIAPLRLRRFVTCGELHWAYLVFSPNFPNTRLIAKPEWLRRKEEKISWSDCVFQPEQQPVAVLSDGQGSDT